MFLGQHLLTIDDKGRLAVPARFRHALEAGGSAQLVVTMADEPCLELYPVPEFHKICHSIEHMENRDHAQLLKRAFVGRAVECELDKQGRIVVPPLLRRQVRLDGSVILVGQINRFELWGEDRWNALHGDGPENAPVSLKDAFRALPR